MKDCFYSNTCKQKDTCDKEAFCVRRFKIDKLLDLSLLSDKQKDIKPLCITDLNSCDEAPYIALAEIQKSIERFVQSGDQLYIYSANPGNGKTSWAIKLLCSYIYKIWYKCDMSCHALFINVPRFLLALKSYISDKSDMYIPHIKENVLEADIVIWDDIATKNTSEFETENLLSIINSRIDAGKCNIFTSNISPVYLSDYVGLRLSSRISQCKQIAFNGHDMRGVEIDTAKCT